MIAKFLQGKGCTRVQKSIFMADMPSDAFQDIAMKLTDIQKMYDYCYNFNDKTKPVLDKEKEAINSMYDKAIKSANMLEQNVPTQQQPQESTDISSVFDKYFSEEGMKISKPDEDPNAAKDGGASNAVDSTD